jgi:ComF family protein
MCVSCHAPFQNAFPLDAAGQCTLCRLGLRGFDAAYSFAAYEGPARQLILMMKFQGVRSLAKPLARIAARALPRDRQFDLIVPMPLHWRRRWTRGFNQSALLTGELSRLLAIPQADPLRRTRNSPAQSGLTAAERRRNVSGAFAVKLGTGLDRLNILLVDDVLTTGSTASAAAAALKRAGAAHVSVLTVARADRRPWAELQAGLKSLALGAK